MKRLSFWLLLAFPVFASAQQAFPAKELSLDGIYGRRASDPTVYCLLGANACVIPGLHTAWTDDPLIKPWFAAHPNAIATKVSSHAWLPGRSWEPLRLAYVWIEEGSDSLNVALVQEGHFPSSVMVDMVEAEHRLAAMYNDPRLARYRDEIRAERAKVREENRPHRLVSEALYARLMKRVALAESQARQQKKGIWSDEGMKGRSVPRDGFLIHNYQDHREWFDRVSELVKEDRRLVEVNRDAKTWASAREAGVPEEKVQEYVQLLTKMAANEALTSVFGLGEACLIVADITYGAFDEGVIKGYVLSPSNPRPLVDDLDAWTSDTAASTAYRAIDENWYLFVLNH